MKSKSIDNIIKIILIICITVTTFYRNVYTLSISTFVLLFLAIIIIRRKPKKIVICIYIISGLLLIISYYFYLVRVL